MFKKLSFIMIALCMVFACSTTRVGKIDNTDKVFKDIEVSKIDTVNIYYEDMLIQKMTYREFESLIKVSKHYIQIRNAEKEGRVLAVLETNPWKLERGKKITTRMHIFWRNKEGEKLKKITLKLSLELPKDGKKMSKIRVIYRDVSEIGFPIATVLMLLLIAL